MLKSIKCIFAVVLVCLMAAGCGSDSGPASTGPLIKSLAPASFTPTRRTVFYHQTLVGASTNTDGTIDPVTRIEGFKTKEGVNVLVFGTRDTNTGTIKRITQIVTWTTDQSHAQYYYFDNKGNLYQVKDKASGDSLAFTYANATMTMQLLDASGKVLSSTTETLQNGKLVVAAASKAVVAMNNPGQAVTLKRKPISVATTRSLDPDDNPPDNDSDDQIPDSFSGDSLAYFNAVVQNLATAVPAGIGTYAKDIGGPLFLAGASLAVGAIFLGLPVAGAAEVALLVGGAMYAGGNFVLNDIIPYIETMQANDSSTTDASDGSTTPSTADAAYYTSVYDDTGQ